MIIDAHTHGFHGKYLDQLIAAGHEWVRQMVNSLSNIIKKKPHYIDVPLRVEQIERCGIDLQVVTFQPTMDSNLLPGDTASQLAMARAINDNMARVMEDSRSKLITAASIPLEALEWGGLEEMKRAINGTWIEGD